MRPRRERPHRSGCRETVAPHDFSRAYAPFGSRPCKNSAKFCKRSGRARLSHFFDSERSKASQKRTKQPRVKTRGSFYTASVELSLPRGIAQLPLFAPSSHCCVSSLGGEGLTLWPGMSQRGGFSSSRSANCFSPNCAQGPMLRPGGRVISEGSGEVAGQAHGRQPRRARYQPSVSPIGWGAMVAC